MFETYTPSKCCFYDEFSFSMLEAENMIQELLKAENDAERNSIFDAALLIRATDDFKTARSYCSAGSYIAGRMNGLGYTTYAETTWERIDQALDIWRSRHENKIKKSKRA